jgi:telomerase Cajal body protein 1
MLKILHLLTLHYSSADGTTLLMSSISPSHASTVHSIILPPDLLAASSVLSLSSYSKVNLPGPVRAVCGSPYFGLSDSYTALVPDIPIRLCNALTLDSPYFESYPYIHPQTESFLAPYSLAFDNDATHFIAGVDSEVSIFDISRPGNPPSQRFKLRKDLYGKSKAWPISRGIVSALDMSIDRVLAVGTFGREIGLFSSGGGGTSITTFSLDEKITGAGVTQVQWTPCGRYLVIGERKSNSILVFDIRGSYRLLQTFINRKADSMMRMGWSMTLNGEIWAGGTDGIVRNWGHIGRQEGSVQPLACWDAHTSRSTPIIPVISRHHSLRDIDPIISTLVHSSGTVAITGSAEDRHNSASDTPYFANKGEPSGKSLTNSTINGWAL